MADQDQLCLLNTEDKEIPDNSHILPNSSNFPAPNSEPEKQNDATEEEKSQKTNDVVESWVNTGCSILADEWTSDDQGKIFLTFNAQCPVGIVFLGSHDVSGILVGSVESLVGLFSQIVEKVGEQNVVQIITQNKQPYIKLGEEIVAKYPKIFWNSCGGDLVDSMLEDFKNIEWVKRIIQQAKVLLRTIYANKFLVFLMRNNTSGVDIVVAGPTASSTDFYIIKRLMSFKTELEKVISSVVWSNYSTEEIPGEPFWEGCKRVGLLLDPILRLLTVVTGKGGPGMGYVYAGMFKAKQEIRKEFVDDYKVYWRILDKLWKPTENTLHTVGFHLNPRFFYNQERIQPWVWSSLYDCIIKMEPDQLVQVDINEEAENYHDHEAGAAALALARIDVNEISPVEWWTIHGASVFPRLKTLACRVLTQGCSIVGCKEKNLKSVEKNLVAGGWLDRMEGMEITWIEGDDVYVEAGGWLDDEEIMAEMSIAG